MEHLTLKKPKISKKFTNAIRLMPRFEELYPFVEAVNQPEYLFWDKVRYKDRPKDISAEQFWELVKFTRANPFIRKQTVVRDKDEQPFSWLLLDHWNYFFRNVDMQLGGVLETGAIGDPDSRKHSIRRGLMEEAIASSQLEGANTTRKVAKQMIREKREPKTRSDRMILNNHRAMTDIQESLKDQPLSEGMLLQLHATLTKNTLDNENEVGRLREANDNIVVTDSDSRVVHVPPQTEFMKKELKELIAYANDNSDKTRFVHPVVKAIILHFWIGYLHPFTDGNGRVARAIFYWYMLRQRYWAFSFLPLSVVIKKSPVQYGNAFIYSEQDDNDLTYFIDYNIRKITQAMKDFEKYSKRVESRNRLVAEISRLEYNLNNRQIQALQYLSKDIGAYTTIKTHSNIYDVTRMTARKDLERLQAEDFLTSKKVGLERRFTATAKAEKLFE